MNKNPSKVTAKQELASDDDDLQAKMGKADPVIKRIIAEQCKEIARLQGLRVKEQVKSESEILGLKAKVRELEKKGALKVIIRDLAREREEREKLDVPSGGKT